MYNTNSDIWIAGAIAAFTVDFIVYPLDTLKTRIQSPHYARLYKNPATGRVNRALLFRGLYQGIWSVVVATIPSSGAFFTTYEGIKHLLGPSDDPHGSKKKKVLPTPIAHGIASSVAECVSCFILTPAEVLKQNAQMINSSGNTANTRRRSATLTVLSHFRSRPLQLWRGYGALVARNLPFTAIQFPIFEHLRDRISAVYGAQPGRQSDASEMLNRAGITALSAGLAGAFAAVVTTPIDVIKTRIMLGAGKRGARPGAIALGREIYAREGLRALFSGGLLRAGWTALGIGLYLSAYESGRMYLEARRKKLDAVAVGGRREGQPVI